MRNETPSSIAVPRVPNWLSDFARSGCYGRYVADIFYHPTIARKEQVYSEGFFLNAELLAAGLADPVL